MKIFKSSIHFSKLAGVWKVFFYVITIFPIHSPLVLLLLQHIFSWRNHSPISMISFKAISAFYFSAFLLFEYSTFSAKSFLFILSKDIFSCGSATASAVQCKALQFFPQHFSCQHSRCIFAGNTNCFQLFFCFHYQRLWMVPLPFCLGIQQTDPLLKGGVKTLQTTDSVTRVVSSSALQTAFFSVFSPVGCNLAEQNGGKKGQQFIPVLIGSRSPYMSTLAMHIVSVMNALMFLECPYYYTVVTDFHLVSNFKCWI